MNNRINEVDRSVIDPDFSVGRTKFRKPASKHAYGGYGRPYTFSRPTPERGYMKALKYIAEHPGCKRAEIIDAAGWRPGTHQSVFQDMSHAELFRISTKGEYFITAKGACLVKDTYGYLGENHKIDYNKVLQETTESNAWQQGFDAAMKAHIEGHNIDPNRFLPDSPYDEGTMEDDEWVAGWVAAYDNCC